MSTQRYTPEFKEEAGWLTYENEVCLSPTQIVSKGCDNGLLSKRGRLIDGIGNLWPGAWTLTGRLSGTP